MYILTYLVIEVWSILQIISTFESEHTVWYFTHGEGPIFSQVEANFDCTN